MSFGENFGELQFTVWPPYAGLSTSDPGVGPTAPGEPFEDLNYTRAMIQWRTEPDGDILGSARIYIPAGIFTHIVFFSGPGREHPLMAPAKKLDHPIVFDRPGVVELNPIKNTDYLPR